MRNQDSFEELLEQSLQNGNQNYFAFALARSRQEEPTARGLELLKQLISEQGDKWLEVLSRQALTDYRRVFNHCINYPFTYPSLITMASSLQNPQELQNIETRIIQVMESKYEKLQTRWNIFATLISKYANSEDYQAETIRIMPLVNRFLEKRPFVEDMQELYSQQVKLSCLPSSEYFVTYFAVVAGICRLFRKGMQVSLKAMRYLDFIRNHPAIINWMKEIFPFVVCSFQNLRQFASYGHTIEGMMYSNALSCLVDFSNINEIAQQLQDHSAMLIRFLIEQPLLKAWDSQKKQIAEDLNFEYGLVMGEYGDDNPSILTSAINKFSSYLPSFLREYISALSSPQMTKSLPEGEIYMKLAVVHKAVKDRDDLVLQLVQPFLQLLLRDIEPTLPVATHSQINYCRKLRLLYLYSSILKQSFFNSLLDKITIMLKQTNDETYYFAQAIYIFQQILGESSPKPQDNTLSKMARLLKDNLHFIVLKLLDIIDSASQIVRKGEKRLKLLQLVHKIIDNNQSEATRVNNSVITKCSGWLIEEVGNIWTRGVRTTPFLQELANTLKVAISIIDQEYYMDISDSLYAVLQLLLHSHSLSIQDELIQILVFVLQFQKDVRPPTCSVLVSLQNIVIGDQGNLYSIRKIMKTLCQPELARQILFSWSDLIGHYLNMQMRYFTEFATQNYMNFYFNQWQEQIIIFQNFLQVYEEYLNNNQQTRQNVLFCIHGLPTSEYQLQLFLTMNHQLAVTGYKFYDISFAHCYNKRRTMKLIYLYYMDTLLRNFQERTLNELVQFHALYRQKDRNRKLESDLMSVNSTQVNTATYLREGLLKLRRDSHLDLMDYNSVMGQLHLR